jgi:hypothetical protein
MCILEKIKSWRSKTGKAFGTIMRDLPKNPDDINQLKQLTSFLDSVYPIEKISIQQRFYHVWFGFYEIEVCPCCESSKMFTKKPKFSIDRYGIKPTNSVNYYGTCMSDFCNKKYNLEKTRSKMMENHGTINPMEVPGALNKIKKNNREKYGVDFYTETEEFKEKVKATFLKKYGVHPTKLKETQDKKRKINKEKYGFEHALDNSEVKEKSRITNNLKYGGNSSMCSDEIRNKSKETNRKNHGVDWYVQSGDFKKKFKQTMIANYGVEQVMHYTPSFEKSLNTSYKKKIFVFPSGRIEKIQGYEGFGLNEILDTGYPEDVIVVSNKEIESYTGTIWYYDKYEDKKKKYYPDIYLKSENKIIEVKCDYTYNSGYSRNILKKQACLDLGLSFGFWIYDKNGKRTIK